MTFPLFDCRNRWNSLHAFKPSVCQRWPNQFPVHFTRAWLVFVDMDELLMVSVFFLLSLSSSFDFSACAFADSQDLSTDLKWVDKRIISNSQCTKTYGPAVVLMSTVCTIGWDYNGQSTCNGDSGGPLVIDEGGIWTQIGVVSFVSNQGCGAGHPAGYVRTTSFLNWVSTQTGIPIRL